MNVLGQICLDWSGTSKKIKKIKQLGSTVSDRLSITCTTHSYKNKNNLGLRSSTIWELQIAVRVLFWSICFTTNALKENRKSNYCDVKVSGFRC